MSSGSETLRVAVLGCGVVGGGMAGRLLGLGHHVVAYDLRAEAMERLRQAGAEPAGSAADAAARTDYCIVSLPREDDVYACFTGAGGLLDGLRPGGLVVETSTVPPSVATTLAASVEATGAGFVDAPLCPSHGADSLFSSTNDAGRDADDAGWSNLAGLAAASGQLCFFVGGDTETVARARPVLEALSAVHHHVGPIGAGKTVKLLHNAINLTTAALMAEMLVVAEARGLALDAVVDALKDSLADSRMLRSQIDRFTVPRKFPTGLFPIDYGAKDLAYASALAAAVGAERSVLDAAARLFAQASEVGFGAHYTPGMFLALAAFRQVTPVS